MKWSFILQQKLKATGLLLSLMLVILFTATSLKNEVQDMEQPVIERYTDRLQLAVDLVYITDRLHDKRLLLEKQLMSKSLLPPANLTVDLNQYDVSIRDRLGQFEKMKLTESEARWLSRFKKCWSQGISVEGSVLRLIESGHQEIAIQVFYKQGLPLFKQSVQSLQKLAQIQSETGYKAAKKTHRTTTLLIAISVVIVLLTLTLIQWAKQLNHPLSHSIKTEESPS